MSVRSFTESECAVVGVDDNPNPSMQSSNARKGEATDTKEPQANTTRYRRPTPYVIDVERFRHEGVSQPELETHDASIDSPRGRSCRPCTPSRTRAPTPHPRGVEPDAENPKVHWAKPLKQKPPKQMKEPMSEPTTPKSAMKKKLTIDQKKMRSTTEEEGQRKQVPEAQPAQQVELTAKADETQTRTRHRQRGSSIPKPKRDISKHIAPRSEAPSTAISPRIPSNIPVPMSTLKQSPDKTKPTTARDFSFRAEPEVLSVGRQPKADSSKPPTGRDFSFHPGPEVLSIGRQQSSEETKSTTVRDFFVHKPEVFSVGRQPSLSPSKSTTPRDFSFHPGAEVLSVKQDRASMITDDQLSRHPTSCLRATRKRSGIKFPTVSEEERSVIKTTPSVVPVSRKEVTLPSASIPKPILLSAAPESVEVDAKTTHGSLAQAKLLMAPAPARVSSFHSAKSFWSGPDAYTSVVAHVDSSSSEPTTPGFPGSRSSISDSSKTPIVSSVSSDTMEEDDQSDGKNDACKADSVVTTSKSNHAAKGNLDTKRHISLYTTDSIMGPYPSKPVASSAPEAEGIRSIEADMWNDIMDFCAMESSLDLSLSLGAPLEKDDNYDCCLLEEMKLLVDEFGTITLVDEKDRAFVKEE